MCEGSRGRRERACKDGAETSVTGQRMLRAGLEGPGVGFGVPVPAVLCHSGHERPWHLRGDAEGQQMAEGAACTQDERSEAKELTLWQQEGR